MREIATLRFRLGMDVPVLAVPVAGAAVSAASPFSPTSSRVPLCFNATAFDSTNKVASISVPTIGDRAANGNPAGHVLPWLSAQPHRIARRRTTHE